MQKDKERKEASEPKASLKQGEKKKRKSHFKEGIFVQLPLNQILEQELSQERWFVWEQVRWGQEFQAGRACGGQ